MHDPLASILRDYPVIILDGALATELERRGCDLRDPLWSAKVLIEAPELIRQVHGDYFAAGADVAISASYQASFAGFAQRGFEHQQAVELMQLAVRLAAEARDTCWADPANRYGRPRPLVAASIGPYGATLHNGSEYHGNYGLAEEELVAFHRPRMAVLAACGADLLACETIPSLIEARALVRLLPEFPQLTAWISFSCRDSVHTGHGETLAECAALLDGVPQVTAVGLNCTDPRYVTDLIRAARGATSKTIVVYPNSGEHWDAAGGTWLGETHCSAFGEAARGWYDAGARLIGGCCRTTPAHIRELAQILRPGH